MPDQPRPGDDPWNELPRAHDLALRLARLGADVDLIARCLGIEPEGVAPLLAVAGAKARAVGAVEPTPAPHAPPDEASQPDPRQQPGPGPHSCGHDSKERQP